MIGSPFLRLPGILIFIVGFTLQAGATSAVKAVKMGAKLGRGRRVRAPARRGAADDAAITSEVIAAPRRPGYAAADGLPARPLTGVGPLLREWRHRRRRSQLELALEAGVSARHISFLETGRSNPSREMVIGLAANLEMPLRDRNELLIAAGYAPEYRELAYEDPDLEPVRAAIDQVLAAHDPYPALVVDRQWELVTANRGLGPAHRGRRAAPAGAARQRDADRPAPGRDGAADPQLGDWRDKIARPDRAPGAADRGTGDGRAARRARRLPGARGGGRRRARRRSTTTSSSPLLLRGPDGEELNFFSTVATFGTAVDMTVAELSIESFFPADDVTAAACRAFAPR